MVGPRLCVFIACSVDGYIADTSGGLEWLDRAVGEDEDYGYDEFIADVDLLAMGRGTYDHIAHLDPLPFGGRLVEVFTHRPLSDRVDAAAVESSPAEAVERWRNQGVGKVYVDGGVLIASFLSIGAIDELTITVAPVLLGDGRRLFPVHTGPRALELDAVRSWPSGVVQLRYRGAAPPAAGPLSGRPLRGV